MKKSKIIVPALAVLLLSTAASVTGTVAWFTANRVFEMKAGQFAVVNTKNNLEAVVTPQVGTTKPGDKDIVVPASNKLTDASFNFNSVQRDIIEPDENGEKLDNIIKLAQATSANSSMLERETNIYSAFTWDIQFKMSFSTSAENNVGLYFDLSKSWAHEVTIFEASHVITAKEAGDYYSNPDLTGTHFEVHENDVVGAAEKITAGTWYKAAPDDTGKGFRMAFAPIHTDGTSVGYTKVWAPHQENTDTPAATNLYYIDDNTVAAYDDFDAEHTYAVDDYVIYQNAVYKCKVAGANAWNVANWDKVNPTLESLKTAVGTSTSKVTGDTVTANQTVASAIMSSADAGTEIPAAGTTSNAIGYHKHFLGYFAPNPGNTVTMTYRVVAWYEGTDPTIVNTSATIYETMTSNLVFEALQLTDHA